MSSDQERLASLEAHKESTGKAIDAIFNYMEEGRTWRGETTACLTRLVVNQEGMKEYQVKCDSDRKDISSRVTGIEMGESRQAGRSSVITAIMAASVSGIVAFMPDLIRWLHK